MQDLLDVLVCVRLHADTFSWEIGGNHLTRGSWICSYLLVSVGKLFAGISKALVCDVDVHNLMHS